MDDDRVQRGPALTETGRHGARAGRWRRLFRRSGAVLIISGALLITEAVLTVVWQEPISGLFAAREQAQLEDRLAQAVAEAMGDARSLRGKHDEAGRVAALARRYDRRLQDGDVLGRLELPALDRSFMVAHGGDVQAELRKGPAHYPDTPLPGQGGTVGIAGHRTTYGAPFRALHELRPGQTVLLETPYARFRYRVEKTVSVLPTEVWVKRPVAYERLILSASHPPYSAARRLVTFSRLVDVQPRGPNHSSTA